MVIYIMPYKVSAYGLSDIGLVRQNNEDVWAQLPEESFYILADGMGGHQAGEVAARESVAHLCTLLKQKKSQVLLNLESAQKIIYQAIQYVNHVVYQMGRCNEHLKGMGTTLCCILIHEDGLVYGHVGDSRIYRLRNQTLEQLTQDHSLVRELIDMGQLNEQQADGFVYKNIITKAIGTENYVEPSVQIDTVEVGDLFLLCSDGLTDLLQQHEIQKIMLNNQSEQEITKQLIKAAKQKGGYDNITVVVVKIQGKNDKTDISGS